MRLKLARNAPFPAYLSRNALARGEAAKVPGLKMTQEPEAIHLIKQEKSAQLQRRSNTHASF